MTTLNTTPTTPEIVTPLLALAGALTGAATGLVAWGEATGLVAWGEATGLLPAGQASLIPVPRFVCPTQPAGVVVFELGVEQLSTTPFSQ